jgi:IPT/TIG domain
MSWLRPPAAPQAPAARLPLAVVVAVLVGLGLARFSTVSAQPGPPAPAADPAFFAATGYRVAGPDFWAYFLARGGVRTFGYPISNDFPLLGKRVQIFQRAVLQQGADGAITPADLLDGSYLPFVHADGLTLPKADPGLLAAAPTPASPNYLAAAKAFIDATVPDQWDDQPVNFASTYYGTVTCDDIATTGTPCDPTLLPWLALEVWGLPTSAPARDPRNDDFIYQRFQRGVLFYSATTGQTQWLLMGDWLKRAMTNQQLPPDLAAEAAGSRFLNQLAPGRPLGLARPADLPDTSLAQAFEPASGFASAQLTVAPAFQTATSVSETATAIVAGGTATSVSATQTALAGTLGTLGTATPTLSAAGLASTATALSLTSTAVALTGTLPVPSETPGTPGAPTLPVPTLGPAALTPVSNAGCRGDEQMFFVPRKPYVATRVQISVTSQRRHNAQVMALTGPLDTGVPIERPGLTGWVWTWTVTPTVEAFHQFTFYADGLHPCITSGFNAYTALGATATPTPTNLPGPTEAPTNTPTPGVPSVRSIQPTSGDCAQTITILGSNFGTPASGSGTPAGAQVFFGGRVATIINWTNTAILIGIPSGAPAGSNPIVVSVPGGGFSQGPSFNLSVVGTPVNGTPVSTSCP